MNKTNLNEKWGKYCNTNKLVDDMIALLKNYGHRCTEQGVCAMLDKYFTNKEPLIKLLMKSDNYIGGMRIALKKDFERKIDEREIRSFIYGLRQTLNTERLLNYKDESGKSLFDNLSTGCMIFDINKIPKRKEIDESVEKVRSFNYETFATASSNETYNAFNAHIGYFANIASSTFPSNLSHNGVELKHGTKTSRAFNKVCAHYGVDKFPEYNKVFARYADLVSGLVRKENFVISVNPLDYLTMSLGVSWRSCHMIDGSMYQGGCLSYMLDKTSIITFVVDDIDGEIHNTRRLYRQMFHYSNDMFMQNRLYPQGNDGATDLYEKFRGFMVEEFSKLLGVDNKWKVDCGYEHCRNHVVSVGTHYKDYNHNNSCAVFYPEKKKTKLSDYVMTVGHDGICPHCGKAFTSAGYISHGKCVVSNEEEVFEWR